jgi:3-hydroxybutyryl-CoA dehydrogenase
MSLSSEISQSRPISPISKVGVVGGGIMGSGIAEVAARSGCEVLIREIDAAACEVTQQRIERSLDKAVRSDKLSVADRNATVARLGYVTDLEALADRDIVIEAVIEAEDLTTQIFRTLGAETAPACWPATRRPSRS